MDRENEVQIHVARFLRLWLAGPRCGSLHRKHGPQESITSTCTPTCILLIAWDDCRAVAQLALGGFRWLPVVFWEFVSVGNRVE